MRAAFNGLVEDKAFKEEIVKAKFELSPATGEEVQKAVAAATRIDDKLAQTIRGMVKAK